jgi:hypothetical protein
MKINLHIRHGRLPYSLLLLALILISLLPAAAQDVKVVRDIYLWTGAAIEKSFGKDWTLSLGEEIRFKHNISEVNNYFTEAGLGYRISKNFELEGGYRYTRDRKSDASYEALTRYNLDLKYRGRMDFIRVDYRLRYQKEVEGLNLLRQGISYEKYVRNRIRIRYTDFKRLSPYVSVEIFQLFKFAQPGEFQYLRVLGGVKFEPGNMGSFNLAYGFNREFSPIEPAVIYMFKLNYTYEF